MSVVPLKNILKDKQSIKLKDYFEIVNPTYSVLKITPNTSNRNYDTELIAKTIAGMFKAPIQRIEKERFKISYYLPAKVSFIVDITKNNCELFLICPQEYSRLFKEKCSEIWNRITIDEVEKIKEIGLGASKYRLNYFKEDALSLNVNKKSNDPLNNILNVMDIMEENDRVNIFYNFVPMGQTRWRGLYKETMKKIEQGIPIEKNPFEPKNIGLYIALGLIKLFNSILELAGEIIGVQKKENKLLVPTTFTYVESKLSSLSKTTKQKENATIVGTQILVTSKSKDKKREANNAISVCESYKSISQDNTLVYKKIKDKGDVNFQKYQVSNIPVNKMSTQEANNLLQIPGRELLDKHKAITKVDVLENPIPEELQKGYMYLGKTTYRGKEYDAYIRDEYNFGNLALLLLSPQGGGKTTLISNLVVNAHKRKECCIIPDYIKNCELSQTIEKLIPPEDIINIDLSKKENFQGLGFNEVKSEGRTEFEKLEVANMKAEQTMAFIDSVNADGLPLSSKMRRMLSASSNVVYLHDNTSIGDVIKCLTDYQLRHEYVNYIGTLSEDSKKYFRSMVNTLRELDEVRDIKDKDTKKIISTEIVGTKDSKIEGILDRVNLIEENIYLKYMFNMSCQNNVDFVEAMNEGKIVLIKMPEDKFNNAMVKNVLVTFFTSKIVLSTKLRGAKFEKPKRCHVFYDEISQAPTAEHVICNVLSQLRKFGTKIIISAHYLGQLNTRLKNEIKASGASYMLLQGSDKKIFDELKEELSPYELDDLLNMKQWHSLNLMRYEKGYAKFITHLPNKPKVKG